MGFLDKIRTPKWQNRNVRVRREAVTKLKDQKILIDIARNDSNWMVRDVAIDRINDESILIDIAENDKNADIRKKVIKRINNHDILENIAKEENNDSVYGDILKKLYNIDYDVRKSKTADIEDIDDEITLLYILNSGGTDKRLAASNKLTKLGYNVEDNVKFPAPFQANKKVLIDNKNKVVSRIRPKPNKK